MFGMCGPAVLLKICGHFNSDQIN
uniref:Uncharacterized protein n=1 Tax=Anguilla anguilla TaxID=7936 RepID=A0A0E9PZM1_ANGAN